ncbi:MAG: S9 family peptidase [Alphaproteobacteria bacterium]
MDSPKAKKHEHITELHNEKIIDNYSWLRAKDWPNHIDEDILQYLKEENNYYNKVMAPHKKLEEKLFNEMKGRIKLADESVPIRHDDFFYYSYTTEDSQYPIYCRKKNLLSNENEVIFDQNKEAEGHKFFTVGDFSVSPNHKLLVYSVDLNGSERYSVKIKDLSTNQILSDEINNVIGDIYWHSNNLGFFYTELDENWRARKVYYHLLGTKQQEDKLLYHEKDDKFSLGIDKSASKKYIFIETSSYTNNEIYYISLEDPSLTPELIFERKANHFYYVDHHSEYFYILTNDKGKNFRLVKTPIDNIEINNLHELIAHNQNIYLNEFYLYRNNLVIASKQNGLSNITVSDLNYKNPKSIDFFDPAYTAQVIYTDYDDDNLRFNYASLNTPDSIIEYNFTTGEQKIVKVKEIPSGFDKNLYKVERVFAKNGDIEVPISLVYRKDKFKMGENPLYLYGYGSYGIAIAPTFKNSIFSLIDRGFVYAIAHIRGGDDLGYEWYESAKFLNKKRTFEDFIACAKYLITQNYTSKGNIVISGGSAGGMLVAAAVNMEPDLFKLVIAKAPFVDVLNTMLDETLPLTPGEFSEWGNPKDKDYYSYIKSYSPYDNIKKMFYPPMYISAGLYDPRVTYWEPAKYVAKLREYKTDKNLLLFETNMEQGHKGASGRFDYLLEIAKEYNFILKIHNIHN